MRISILLITIILATNLSAQTFRWNSPADTQARTAQSTNQQDPMIDESGYAVFYADYLEGNPTALGETYRHDLMTAAHRKLPLGTIVKVTRMDNGISTTVRINDRGGYCDGCIIDLSRAAAQQIDLLRVGRAQVALTVLGFSNTNPPTPLNYRGSAGNSPNARQTYTLKEGNPYDRQPAQGGDFTARSIDTRFDTNPAGVSAYEDRPQPAEYNNTIPVRRPQQAVNSSTVTARRPATTTTTRANIPNSGVALLTERIPGYAIQLGSYGQFANAERHVMTLQDKGFNSLFVMPQERPDGSIINRVIVAPFESIRQAEDYLADLRQYHQMEGLIITM